MQSNFWDDSKIWRPVKGYGIRLAQYVNQFLVWPKISGPAQNILGWSKFFVPDKKMICIK